MITLSGLEYATLVVLSVIVLVGLHAISTKLTRLREIMPSIQEVKDAVAAAVGRAKDAITAAVTKESDEVKAQIQTLKDQISNGTPVTQADLDEIVNGIDGIGPAATGSIDTISTSDGA